MHTVRIRSKAVNKTFLEQRFRAALRGFPLHSAQTACRHLSQYSLLEQRTEPRVILLNGSIALDVRKHRNNAECSQFKDHAFSFWQPCAVPQFKQEISAAIQSGDAA